MKKILICSVLAVSLLVSASARADMSLMLIPGNLFTHDDTLRVVAGAVFNETSNEDVHASWVGPPRIGGIAIAVDDDNVIGRLTADFTNWTSSFSDASTWSAIRIWGTGNIADLQINGMMVSTDWLTPDLDLIGNPALFGDPRTMANDEWSFWYLINNDVGEILNISFDATRTGSPWLVGITIYESGNPSIIPEPATLAVVGLGWAGLGLARIRRKK